MSFTPPPDRMKANQEISIVPSVADFPSHWMDGADPNVQSESPQLSQIRGHCTTEALYHPTEFPFEDAPFDPEQPLETTDNLEIDYRLLDFLSRKDKPEAMGLPPVFIYHFLARTATENLKHLTDLIEGLPSRSPGDSQLADEIVWIIEKHCGRGNCHGQYNVQESL